MNFSIESLQQSWLKAMCMALRIIFFVSFELQTPMNHREAAKECCNVSPAAQVLLSECCCVNTEWMVLCSCCCTSVVA